MNASQTFHLALRILGVFLLVQAVLQAPTLIVDGAVILWQLIHGRFATIGGDYIARSLSLALWTSALSVLLYVATAWYLIKGALLLCRLAGINLFDPDPTLTKP